MLGWQKSVGLHLFKNKKEKKNKDSTLQTAFFEMEKLQIKFYKFSILKNFLFMMTTLWTKIRLL